MEILLLQDVSGVGKKNDLLVVGDGYALNYLLPHRKALVATPTVRKRYADQIRKRAEEKEQERALRANAAAALAGKSVTFTKKVTKTGKLYAAINEQQISEAMKTQLGVEFSPDAIQMDEHIKATGNFTVKIKIGDGQQALGVVVKAE
ncbi:50S ribosomal protein L9 [Candidatus Peribacteria bacterium RIFCSPHIGHO2_02_FULL_52_16]|nr:MAG: 50S ribosomal protein L9 [Candidatus Peribacteria bacterium RIFCSPHIGHO2_01_FULL_51_35]OGJ61118.1 MAG: 50S ribosomal protein L9 [Candidatus Peribacteria bacterium RIFCSPHIGHO2_02_FULL_52_16]